MATPLRRATEHLAAAWAHAESGEKALCLNELDQAMEILRPPAAPPAPKPKVMPNWKGAEPARTGPRPKPIESDTEWWPDSVVAGEALGCPSATVRNACLYSHERTVKGVAVRYSKYATRAGWEMGRKLAARRAAEQSAAMLS